MRKKDLWVSIWIEQSAGGSWASCLWHGDPGSLHRSVLPLRLVLLGPLFWPQAAPLVALQLSPGVAALEEEVDLHAGNFGSGEPWRCYKGWASVPEAVSEPDEGEGVLISAFSPPEATAQKRCRPGMKKQERKCVSSAKCGFPGAGPRPPCDHQPEAPSDQKGLGAWG